MRELAVGSIVAGHRIDQLIARGGMGVVYRATHLSLERERALKLIAPELAADEDFRTRFRREWRLAASIDNPHAIPIYDAGEADGLLYISMRYVEGTDLRTTISREGPLAPDLAAKIVAQVASALDAAHGRGLIHRDIKPANILLERRNGDFHASLTDFGLSKHAASTVQLTDAGHWVGTVDYVAPEQIEGKPLDARTDIYGLGCVAFESLTGTVPYPRDNDVAKIWAHINDPPASLANTAPHLPQGLDAVVQRAMAKQRDDRYLSAGDFGRATLAAAHGRSYSEPERSVATGEAAPAGAAAHTASNDASTHESVLLAQAGASQGFGARLRGRYRALMFVGLALALLVAVLTVAVVVPGEGGSGSDGALLPQETLAEYQDQVGRICGARNKVNKSATRRVGPYRARLRRAKRLQTLRDTIVEEVQHRINTSTNLRARLGGLDPPSATLGVTQRRTVRNWDQNISRFQSHRDRLNGVLRYPELRQVVSRFNSGQRTAIERTGTKTAVGLQRLGGRECKLETRRTSRPVPLPPDPSGGFGDTGPSPDTNPPVPAPDANPPALDAAAPGGGGSAGHGGR